MKKWLLLFSCIILGTDLTYADNIIIKVENKIYSEQIEINFDEKMLRAIGERHWVMQNEKETNNIYKNYDQIENVIKKEQYKTVISELEKQRYHSDYNKAHRLLAFAYFKLGDYINAIKNYNLCIKNNDIINPLIYYERGFARFKINDYTGALKDYSFAKNNGLKMNEKLITGETISDYTKFSQAIINKEQNLKINDYFFIPISKYTVQTIDLGKRTPQKKNNISEIDYYKYLIESDNKYILAESYNNLAAVLIKKDDLKDAKIMLENAYKINSSLKEMLYNLALVNYLNKEYNEALSLIQKYFQLEISQNDKKIQQYYNAYILYICSNLYAKGNNKLIEPSKNYSNRYIKSYKYVHNKQYVKSIKELNAVIRNIKIDEYMMKDSSYSTDWFYENYIGYRNIAYKDIVYSDLAFVYFLSQDNKKALESLQKAKKYSFENNNIDLYEKNIQLENMVLLKLKEKQK